MSRMARASAEVPLSQTSKPLPTGLPNDLGTRDLMAFLTSSLATSLSIWPEVVLSSLASAAQGSPAASWTPPTMAIPVWTRVSASDVHSESRRRNWSGSISWSGEAPA